MVKTLELAITKAGSLPEAVQELLGRELLERLDALSRLRGRSMSGLARSMPVRASRSISRR
jgi:hypothetical protein